MYQKDFESHILKYEHNLTVRVYAGTRMSDKCGHPICVFSSKSMYRNHLKHHTIITLWKDWKTGKSDETGSINKSWLFKELIWVVCWHWGLVLGSSWLLVRLCESEYPGRESPFYVQVCRVRENTSVLEFQGWESQGRGDYQTPGRIPCGWGRTKERDGDSSAEATAALHCYGSDASSHWTPSPRAPAG